MEKIKNRFTGEIMCGGLSLKIVLENHKKWLRDEEGGSRADLSCADLSRADLSRAYLSRADLSHAYLYGADLSDANLSHAYLYGADLSHAYLSHAYLYGADLSHAYLSRANLSDANLSHAYLYGADLSHAYLSRADLSCADLSDANLSCADLSRANLSCADLSRANLSDANLSRADLRIFKHDIWAVLVYAPKEVPNLLKAMKDGKIDGSVYEGDCCCLCGTLEKGIGQEIPIRDPSSPAEQWFSMIKKGDKPEDNQVLKQAIEWVEEWQKLTKGE